MTSSWFLIQHVGLSYIKHLAQFIGDVLVCNIRLVCMDSRLTFNDVLKDFLLKGDSELTETNLFYPIVSISGH